MINIIDEEQLTQMLKTLSDPTRRLLINKLTQEGALQVTILAKHFDISLNGISKHIKVLEKANLIHRKKLGRIHLIEVNLSNIIIIEDWLKSLKSIWKIRLDNLSSIIENKDNQNE